MTSKAGLPFFLLGAFLSCAVAVGGGCTSTESSPRATQACDPLAVEAPPIALAALVAAGRAADGTVYVLDRGPVGVGTDFRAFVSDGSVLRRRNVTGTGESPDFVIVTLDDDPSNPRQLRVELANGAPTRMGVFRGAPDPKTKSFEIGQQGEELVLLSAGELAGFTVVNLSKMGVLYAATTNDGHRFVAFEPEIDLSNDKVRVFYGTDDRMQERKVLDVSRDSSVHLRFDLDGVDTTAQLIFCGSSAYWGQPRLQSAAGAEIPLTPVPGSPGALECPSYYAPTVADGGAADGGEDAGAAAPSPRAEASTLVAGLRFYCF